MKKQIDAQSYEPSPAQVAIRNLRLMQIREKYQASTISDAHNKVFDGNLQGSLMGNKKFEGLQQDANRRRITRELTKSAGRNDGFQNFMFQVNPVYESP